jgi:hypothetical protein
VEVFLCSGPLRRAALFFWVLFGGGFCPIRPPRSLAVAAPAGDAAWLTPQAPRRGCRWPQVVRPGSDPRVGCHWVSATRSPTPGFPLDDNGRSATGDSPWPSRGLTWHRVVGLRFSSGLRLVQTWRGSHGFRLAAAPARFLSPLPTATIGLGWGIHPSAGLIHWHGRPQGPPGPRTRRRESWDVVRERCVGVDGVRAGCGEG